MIDEARWRAIMSHWATGVSVVTSLGPNGPRGATAPEDTKFDEVEYTLSHETPVIDGSLAWIACGVHEELRGGDHAIVIGAPLAGDLAPGLEPLLHHRGEYRRL